MVTKNDLALKPARAATFEFNQYLQTRFSDPQIYNPQTELALLLDIKHQNLSNRKLFFKRSRLEIDNRNQQN